MTNALFVMVKGGFAKTMKTNRGLAQVIEQMRVVAVLVRRAYAARCTMTKRQSISASGA